MKLPTLASLWSGQKSPASDFNDHPDEFDRLWRGFMTARATLGLVLVALQVSLLSEAGAATQIFDEVDAGIGGTTADVVGQQLRALGARRQVLCVTHLAQVAARGLDHFGIAKSVQAGNTFTRVRRLNAEARVDELSRMLGGTGSGGSTGSLARELLAKAAADA